MANWLRNFKTKSPIDSSLIKYNSSDSDTRSVKDVLDDAYKASDTYSNVSGNMTVLFGMITNGAKNISLICHVPKSMANVTPSLTYLAGGLRGSGGMIENTSDSGVWTLTNYTVTCEKVDNYTVRIDIAKATAFTNATNNSTLSLKGRLTLTFS